MRSRRMRAFLICALCIVLVFVLLLLSFCGTPKGEFQSEYGTRYYITDDEIARLDTPASLSFGKEQKEFFLNVVYDYDVYSKDFERRIVMHLVRVEYEGEDTAVKNLVASLNRDIAAENAQVYDFAGLTLKAKTDATYTRGAGSVRINGELLERVGK